MSSPIFCDNCGMLKENCTCGEFKSIEDSDNPNPTLNWFKKSKKDDIEIPEVYSLEDNSLSSEEIQILKEKYPHIKEEILENFPFETPRPGQLEIIEDIEDAIASGYKYIVLEAGTGTGKSAIASTLARMYDSAYILTMTKQLQSQYQNEFNFPLVKGRSNFTCLNDINLSCDMGTCKTLPASTKFECSYGISKNPTLDGIEAFQDSRGSSIFYRSGEHCQYWQQKANSINSHITLMNYDYAVLELNYVKHFSPRTLMILDEAHNIEDKLMRIMEVNLYYDRLEKDIHRTISPKTIHGGELEDWIMEVEAIRDAYDEINLKDESVNKTERIRATINRLSVLIDNLKKEPRNWVIDCDDVHASFKPLRVHNYAKDYLLQYGDIIIFLSATILSHKMFAKWLGLNPDEVYHIEVDSPFDVEKRPIYLDLAGKMSASRIKNTAPKTLPIINKILKKHENDKGLIHTNSYKCQKYIMDHIPNTRLISHHSTNRERVLKHFEEEDNPLVLVSPSMSEGVDLPYDKCRFQIIYKVPFPYLGDRQVNMRRKQDNRWYAYKTAMTLMQTYGRGMRAEDDYCETYILDSDIKMLLKSPIYKKLIPDFFKEAIIKK